MAKISARGDREHARWSDGKMTVVLTHKGRLLLKLDRQGNYSHVAGRASRAAGAWDMDSAREYAEGRGLERVAARA